MSCSSHATVGYSSEQAVSIVNVMDDQSPHVLTADIDIDSV